MEVIIEEEDYEGEGWYWTCSNFYDGKFHYYADFREGPFKEKEQAIRDFSKWLALKINADCVASSGQ